MAGVVFLANGGYWRWCVFGSEEDGGVFVEILLGWVGVCIEVSGSKFVSVFSLSSFHALFLRISFLHSSSQPFQLLMSFRDSLRPIQVRSATCDHAFI